MGAPQSAYKAITLPFEVLIPFGLQFLAQDNDGSVHAYAGEPIFDVENGEWMPNDDVPGTAFIVWGRPRADGDSSLVRLQ